jgi:cytoskeletal protein CcmA (bactofilin family)
MADSSQEYATIIGADANFKGDLKFESAAKVLGRFEGSISSKGKVHIADGSDCKAQIKAKEVAVEGRIDGNVQATDRIELKPTGVVQGDIVAARMIMSEGASINGHCQIGPNGQKSTTVTEAKPGIQARTASAAETAETAKSK